MKLLALMFALTSSLSAIAASHQVLRVTNDQDSEVTILSIETDGSGNAVRLKKVTSGNGITVGTTQHSLAEAQRGAVLFKEGNYEVIRIKLSDRFEPQYGGPLKLDYMVNGLTGTRRAANLEAVRVGDDWVLQMNGATVTKARVISNKVLGKVVGVSQIKF